MHAFKASLLTFVAATAMSFAGVTFANETPSSLKNAEIVDAVRAQTLMGAGAKLIDTRVKNEYAEAHIKGAINVPYKEKSAKTADFDASADSFDLTKLPADKSTPIITQCNGPECWKSYKGAAAAIKAGYKKVYWFRGGFPEWKAKGFAVE